MTYSKALIVDDSKLARITLKRKLEALGLTVDEHVYKLVQVCYDLSQQHSEPDNVTLYKVACRCAMDHPLPHS